MQDDSMQVTAAELTDALRSLMSTAETRAPGAPALAPDQVAQQADRLASLSADLASRTAAYVDAEDEAVRLGAEQHLLAQAALDLQIADALFAAAVQAGEAEAPEAIRTTLAPPVSTAELLALLEMPLAQVGAAVQEAAEPTRGPRAAAAPQELVAAAGQTIDQLLDGVVDFGKDAVAGLAGLDTALLKQAAELISAELGKLVADLGEQVSRLVARALAFIVQAYDNLLAALGQEATSEMRRLIAEWLAQLQQGEALSGILATVYETRVSQQRISELVESSQAPPAAFAQTMEQVAALPPQFAARSKLSRQILAALAVIKRFPAARVPWVEVASAAIYLALLGFVVYVGGDYLDAPKLKRLDRVPGVVHVVETGLAM